MIGGFISHVIRFKSEVGTHFLRSLYMSCSSFFQRADMRRKLSLPHGSPAVIRCMSMVDFPSAYAWSYWGSPFFDVLKANRSSSTSHSLVTCSMTFLVRFTWTPPKSLLFHHFYTCNHLGGGGKKPPKIFKLHPKRRGFFPYNRYPGNLEGWRREERVEDGPAFSSNPMNLKACYCSQAMADCHLSGCEQPLFQMMS